MQKQRWGTAFYEKQTKGNGLVDKGDWWELFGSRGGASNIKHQTNAFPWKP